MFKDNDEKTFYIINTAVDKALENLNDGTVKLRAFDKNKDEQLWKKGHPNYEDYFPLSNQAVSNHEFLTAISSSKLGTKGKLFELCLF